ncbi:hypothetical protein SEVIR_5G074400v4 [Setaria viridis]|uniref:Uncharacterized protein n=2 Tax=Setaria TaxID=4554 RepID=K3XNF1_SETIT|nr:uncharacterized protein LOC101760712 [Setaria italica]XP_034593726.1 uncharacterized protein LOC117855477 [Setaria viridis]RCV24324.1 hypothetical protein SETIT_5G075600v2 [Setaria italica]TKW13046.1 hypothetical protein SEVIR_5G074400v2 [Setaria viridis]
MPPSLRPAAVLLVAAVWLWSAACAAGDDGDITSLLPPGTASPFPFCPVRPAGVSTGPFPWMTPPPPSTATFPQDPGFLPSGACPASASGAVAWLPLLAVFSAFLLPWMYR